MDIILSHIEKDAFLWEIIMQDLPHAFMFLRTLSSVFSSSAEVDSSKISKGASK